MKKQFLKLERVLGIFAALAMLFTGCDFANDKSQEKVETPVIALAEDGVTVSISCATADAEIFYYLNDAADSEVKYSEAFKLEEKAEATTYVVNARAQKEGFLPSEKASETFVVKAISKFTVTFNTDGGNEITAQTVIKGGVATKPEDPTKTGYKFAGWYVGETAYDFNAAVTAAITLKAKWTAIPTYTVTFDTDGGSAIDPVTVNQGEKVTKPANPTKTGYSFAGWYVGETAYDFNAAVTVAITLKAKWNIITYEVTFNTDGGSTVAPARVNHGEKVTKPVDPTKAGFTFGGWYAGETAYDFNTAVTAAITLKAKWTPNYTVTFDTDGGSTVAPATVKQGEKVTKPVDPTKENYTFVGWYVENTAYDFNTAVTAAITLKAKWKFNKPSGSYALAIHKCSGAEDNVLDAVTTSWGSEATGEKQYNARLPKADLESVTAGAYVGFTVENADSYLIDNCNWASLGAVLLDAVTKTPIENSKNAKDQYVVNGSFIFEITSDMETKIRQGDKAWDGGIEFHGVGTFSNAYYIPAAGVTPPDPSELWSGSVSIDFKDESKRITLSAGKFTTATNDSVIELTLTTTSGGQFKLPTADWSSSYVGGTATNAGLTDAGDAWWVNEGTTASYKPSADEWAKIKTSGLVIFGSGLTITSVKLK